MTPCYTATNGTILLATGDISTGCNEETYASVREEQFPVSTPYPLTAGDVCWFVSYLHEGDASSRHQLAHQGRSARQNWRKINN